MSISVMKMLLLFLLQITFLTTLTQAFRVSVDVEPFQVSPEGTLNINCSFGLTYEETNYVFIYDRDNELVYGQSYVDNSGTPGEGYEDLLSNPQVKSGWFSINFTLPYCYKSDWFTCYVYDWNMDKGSGSDVLYLGVTPPRADIYIDGSCMTCSDDEVYYRLSEEAPVWFTIQCRVDQVLPTPYFTLTKPFGTGYGISVENPDTCLFNSTYTQSAPVSTLTETTCAAHNAFGETKPSKPITIAPYTGVRLLLPDIMEESATVTINCTSDVSLGDARTITITNGTNNLIYDFYFSPSGGKVGAGFEDMVSNPRSGENGRWAAIDFRIPFAYTDTAFGCTFLGSGTTGSDRRTFREKRFYKMTN